MAPNLPQVASMVAALLPQNREYVSEDLSAFFLSTKSIIKSGKSSLAVKINCIKFSILCVHLLS